MSGAPVDRIEAIMPTALALVGAVRTGPDEVAAVLARADLVALSIALAALVPDDQPLSQLLAWYTESQQQPARTVWVPRPARVLKQCGTHAAFNRHKDRGETPCPACVEAERQTQAERYRIRRDQVAV